MKVIQYGGILIFITAICLFIASLFWGSFNLNKTVVDQFFKDSKPLTKEILLQTAEYEGLLGKSYPNSFQFYKELSAVIISANEQIKEARIAAEGITEDQTNEIINRSIVDNKVVYNENVLNEIYGKTSPEKEKIQASTSWMYAENKTFADTNEFEQNLRSKIDELNSNLANDYYLATDKYFYFSLVSKSAIGSVASNPLMWLLLTFGLGILGALMYIIPNLFLKPIPGIKNNGIYHNPFLNRGWGAYPVFIFLVGFYVLLYFFPYYIVNWTIIVTPVKALFMKGEMASQWFLYGTLYTVSMLVMGIRMFIKYRHSSYQMFRTASVLFFQVIFAFLLVEIMPLFSLPGVDLKNAWPLDYNFATDWNVRNYLEAGHLGKFMFFWGVVLALVVVPIMTYLYGKRWYCSWVCGCGGLAETLGDPYRQLSDKRLFAWKLERWLIYPILVFAVVMTIVVGYNTYHVINFPEEQFSHTLFGINAYKINEWYGFFIGSIFAGVIGTGFYPVLGNRAWCRFGCPLAAYMGIIQRFKSKFRITTNGGQCISCGNCSTYCEQGIDVRAYAQKGENVIRASCVGCGVCAAVCPRGVLKLENASTENRFVSNDILLGNNLDLRELLSEKTDKA